MLARRKEKLVHVKRKGQSHGVHTAPAVLPIVATVLCSHVCLIDGNMLYVKLHMQAQTHGGRACRSVVSQVATLASYLSNMCCPVFILLQASTLASQSSFPSMSAAKAVSLRPAFSLRPVKALSYRGHDDAG